MSLIDTTKNLRKKTTVVFEEREREKEKATPVPDFSMDNFRREVEKKNLCQKRLSFFIEMRKKSI